MKYIFEPADDDTWRRACALTLYPFTMRPATYGPGYELCDRNGRFLGRMELVEA